MGLQRAHYGCERQARTQLRTRYSCFFWKLLGVMLSDCRRRSRGRQSISEPARYNVLYSGREEGTDRHGVERAVQERIICGSMWNQECVHEQLMKMASGLTVKSNAVTFVVGYSPTQASKSSRLPILLALVSNVWQTPSTLLSAASCRP